MTEDNTSPVSKELFNARMDLLEAKIEAAVSSLERENDRQDETIERLADSSTHPAETRRLTERIRKLEEQGEAARDIISNLCYRVKVLWGGITLLGGVLIAIVIALLKSWMGI